MHFVLLGIYGGLGGGMEWRWWGGEVMGAGTSGVGEGMVKRGLTRFYYKRVSGLWDVLGLGNMGQRVCWVIFIIRVRLVCSL